jgi:hypothetical protein
MDFYGPPTGGIKDVRVDNGIVRILGQFDLNTRVQINGWQFVVKAGQSEIDLPMYNYLTGMSTLYGGKNLVTVTSSSGVCDTFEYRFNPNQQ